MALRIIFSSFIAALSQLGDPRFRRVLFLGIGLTVALLIAAYAGLLSLLQWFGAYEVVAEFTGNASWVGGLINLTSLFLILFMSIFLMVPVASAITSMFLDQVADAVEERHYPYLSRAPRVPFGEAFKDTINFLGVLIGANIIAGIVALVFLPFAPFIFWALNGFLLGREYFTLVAMRRVGRADAKTLRRENSGTVWAAGVLMAIPLSIPLVNLLVPIMGAATFTHIFHKLELE